MRLLEEGKKDFRLINKSLFYLILFFAPLTEAQIFFNGLCRYGVYETEPGFKTLQTLNYNNDYYTDFALLSGEDNKIITLSGSEKGVQLKKVVGRGGDVIDKISPITDSSNNIVGYVFISRKSRRAGLLNFSSSGYVSTGTSVKFSSYPSNISIADIEGDSEKEILISGESFDGLEILKRNKGKLDRKKIISKRIFPQAVFIDLNNDGCPDIVAYDLADNKLDFYYNNSKGEFTLVKEIPFNGNFHYLYAYDVNSDNYSDIIYSADRDIHLLLGDSVASYKRDIKITTKYEADKFIPGDFNHDGKVDIAYINKQNSVVSTKFQKDGLEFSGELVYLEKENLVDLIPYYSRFVEGFAALSKPGKIYTITRETFLIENNSIKLSGDADIIAPFEYSSGGFADICYLDTTNKSLNIILRNEDHIPGKFFSVPVNAGYRNIEVNSLNNDEWIFYLYTPEKKLIEIITVNFNSFRVAREFINCSGNIERISLHKPGGDGYPGLSVIQSINAKQMISVYNRQKRYVKVLEREINRHTLDTQVDAGVVYYWVKETYGSRLYSAKLNNKAEPEEEFTIPGDYKYKTSFVFDALNKGENRLVSFFETDASLFLMILPGENERKKPSVRKQIRLKELVNKRSDKTGYESIFENTYTGEISNGLAAKLYFYLNSGKLLYRMDITGKGKHINFTKLSELENAGSYFVENRLNNTRYVVYSDRQEQCIKIKQI